MAEIACSISSGCLPNFTSGIPWLFPDIFLVFPESLSTIFFLFLWKFSSQNQTFSKIIDILILFLQYLFSKMFPWPFPDLLFPDFSKTNRIPCHFPEFSDLADTLSRYGITFAVARTIRGFSKHLFQCESLNDSCRSLATANFEFQIQIYKNHTADQRINSSEPSQSSLTVKWQN